jgi:flagellar basal body rod protein FlgB
MAVNYSTISTSSISGNSISLDAATKQTMAANKQYAAAIATMMSNILIIVYPPF